jgi:hypothetical protein
MANKQQETPRNQPRPNPDRPGDDEEMRRLADGEDIDGDLDDDLPPYQAADEDSEDDIDADQEDGEMRDPSERRQH